MVRRGSSPAVRSPFWPNAAMPRMPRAGSRQRVAAPQHDRDARAGSAATRREGKPRGELM